MNKLISVVVPAFNEAEYLKKTLLSLKSQIYRPMEIIVVDNASTDQTREIAEKYADRVISLSKKGASRARNFGAKFAKGEYLLFLDADTRLSKNAVGNAVKSMKGGWAGGTFKVQYDRESPKIKLIKKIQFFYLGKGKPFYTQSIFTTKKIFESNKGWNEEIQFGEDVDMLRKISRHGKLKFVFNSLMKTSSRRFIKNKDYFYAIMGGALALYGVKSLPFYPIRNAGEKQISKKDVLKKIFQAGKIKNGGIIALAKFKAIRFVR